MKREITVEGEKYIKFSIYEKLKNKKESPKIEKKEVEEKIKKIKRYIMELRQDPILIKKMERALQGDRK